MHFLLSFFIYLILILNTNVSGQLSHMDESIFVNDMCDVKCENEVHTMCPVKDPTAACSPFELHAFKKDTRSEKLLRTFVSGHNGVRNRIAERMKIPNMLKISWDIKLARMAENYFHKCRLGVTDPCTIIPSVMTEKETIVEFFKFRFSETFIVQNMYVQESSIIPYHFAERVIRNWYFNKDGMREPIRADIGDFDGKRLMGENNFTHFAYPFTYRIGCAMARFNGAFHILCNYYPYFRTNTNTMYFQTGNTATKCPPRFPMRDKTFEHLCTDDSSSFMGSGCVRAIDYIGHLILLSFWITLD